MVKVWDQASVTQLGEASCPVEPEARLRVAFSRRCDLPRQGSGVRDAFHQKQGSPTPGRTRRSQKRRFVGRQATHPSGAPTPCRSNCRGRSGSHQIRPREVTRGVSPQAPRRLRIFDLMKQESGEVGLIAEDDPRHIARRRHPAPCRTDQARARRRRAIGHRLKLGSQLVKKSRLECLGVAGGAGIRFPEAISRSRPAARTLVGFCVGARRPEAPSRRPHQIGLDGVARFRFV